MTTEFFLDGSAIRNPLNVKGFYLSREVSPRFNGSVYDQFGQVDGISNMIFNDPDAIAILSELSDTYLTEAKSEFKAVRYGKDLFSGNIDFSTIAGNRDGSIEAGLKDIEGSIFIQNIDKPYALEMTDSGTFSSETAYDSAPLVFDSSKLKIELNSTPANIQITPTFKAEKSSNLLGSLLEGEDFISRPFYKNSTGQKIRLNLSINVTGSIQISSDTVANYKIIIRDSNGNLVFDLPISSSNLITGTSFFVIVDSASLDIPIDSNVSFVMQLVSGVGSVIINLDETATVLVSEGDFENIEIPVISVNDAMLNLINFASDGLLELVPYSGLSNLFLTSYASVRGRNGQLNISFGELWDDLNSLYCLKLTKSDNKLIIESFADSFKNLNPYIIYEVSTYTTPTSFEKLYNSVTSGFSNWKPQNDSGLPEVTAPISMSTKLKSAPSELDLTVKTLVGSLKILSEAYLMRGRPGTENENSDKDQQVFLLSGNPKNKINSLTSLNSWKEVIGDYHGLLAKDSGEGAYMDDSKGKIYLDLSQVGRIFTGKKMILSCNIPTEDYLSIGDVVQVIDIDRQFFVYIESGKHYPLTDDLPDEGNTAFSGRIISVANA